MSKKVRKKVNLAFIADEKARKITFKQRKKGLMKKLDELMKLCDVKACGIISNPYDYNPEEAWPSREGVEEVVSMFKELSIGEQTKKMMDQMGYTRKRIEKAKQQLLKLRGENQDFHIEEFMFGYLKGESMEYHFNGEKDIQRLGDYIDNYHNRLTQRIEILTGESSSSPPRPPPPPPPPSIGVNQDINLDLNQSLDLNSNSNPNPNKRQSFMDLLRKQMGDGESTQTFFPCTDGNHHQVSTSNPVTTGHISSVTAAAADVCAPPTNDP